MTYTYLKIDVQNNSENEWLLAKHHDLQNKLKFSSTYWSYFEGFILFTVNENFK